MSNLLPTALAYLNKGWSVIPVGLDKRPLTNWKEFQSRRATSEELVAWWTTNPEAQIGIVTGAISDLTVIDVEADGDFNIVKDETFLVETGGKGRHFYFKYEKEFKNAVRIFPSVDVRSEGGYVVGPLSKTQKGPYTPLNTMDVARMHPDTKKTFLEANRRELPWYAKPVERQYEKTSTEGIEYHGAPEGGRNDAMTKFAGSLHAKLHPSLWASIGWQMFEDANKKNLPPLSSYELSVIWNSIGQREVQQNPGGRSYDSNATVGRTWGPAPEKKEIGEHHYNDSLADEEEVQREVDSTATLHVSEVAELQQIDTDHTYPIDMAPFDDALLGGFTAGDLIIVAGQSGHGKTSIIQDWSVTLSSGGQSQREKLPSLWFSYEVLAKPMWIKFQSMGATVDTPIYMPKFNDSFETEYVTDVIERAITDWGIRVVCIDHLGFLRPPKGNYSNAADAVTHTVRSLKRLAVKKGLIILMPVHVRKTNSRTPDLNDIRDSLGIAQEADAVFFIGREKDEGGLPTAQAKVWLVKNRKTGISVSAVFDYQFGRYYYNESDTVGLVKADGSKPKDENDW